MIVAEDIHVHFRRGLLGDPIRALDGLSLEVHEGDCFALVGQNGAGKSTAMYCFLGLIRPKSGRVRLMGAPPEPGSGAFARVGYLPEEPHYDLYLTVKEAVRYYASLYRVPVAEKSIYDVLERLDLAQFANLPLQKCSKGMKQKVGIAQCLIGEARLLFLDEPTRGLDPIVVVAFREILRDLNRRGVTIVINTHILSEVEMLANRVAIIHRGRAIAQDSLENLVRADRDWYEVAFETAGGFPPFIERPERRGGSVCGAIPASVLGDFMQFVQSSGVRLIECSLRRATLEEAFMRILKGAPTVENNVQPASAGSPVGKEN
jgi:ABC-2 type transport system ATP-binding protein